MFKIYTRFQTKTAQKPYPLGRHIPIYHIPPGGGVKVIIHYGPSRNIEACLHKDGSGGRNTPDTVVILYSNFILKYCCE